MDDPMALLHEADSEHTKCYNKRDADARMVRLHGKTLLTPNNFVVCGQKHKVWILLFLVRISRTL